MTYNKFDSELHHLEWYLDIGLTQFQALRTQLEELNAEDEERKKEIICKLEELGEELKAINKKVEELRKEKK